MRRPVAIASGLGIAFLAFSGVVQLGWMSGVDRAAHAALERAWWQPSFPLWEGVAVAGGIEVTSAIAALAFIGLAWRRRWKAAAALLVFPAALVAEVLARFLVVHAPPPVTHAGHLTLVSGAAESFDSYPSGHVVRVVILAGVGAALLGRRWAVRGAVAVSVLVAFDRLYLSAHWTSDVVGGALLGGAALAAAVAWLALPLSGLRSGAHRRSARRGDGA